MPYCGRDEDKAELALAKGHLDKFLDLYLTRAKVFVMMMMLILMIRMVLMVLVGLIVLVIHVTGQGYGLGQQHPDP